MTRVLIIEDDKDFAADAMEVLEHQGFEVEIATSYTESIEKLNARKYDVISLDIMMPVDDIEDRSTREKARHGKETGLLIYPVIQQQCPDARVVVCTVVDEVLGNRLRPGDSLIEKPVGVDDYVAAISKATQRS